MISPEQMDLHYNKHHQSYITNLNKIVPKMDDARALGDFKAFAKL